MYRKATLASKTKSVAQRNTFDGDGAPNVSTTGLPGNQNVAYKHPPAGIISPSDNGKSSCRTTPTSGWQQNGPRREQKHGPRSGGPLLRVSVVSGDHAAGTGRYPCFSVEDLSAGSRCPERLASDAAWAWSSRS